MNILLDTHIALWAVANDPRLSGKARNIILDPDNTIYYSTVSVWEVLLKHDVNPKNLSITASDFCEYCQSAGYFPLGLSDKHVLAVESLSHPNHNDPFDRLLIVQAKVENFSLITHDSVIPTYDERCIIAV